MLKLAGSGSISQRHESPDPDPYKMSRARNTGANHLLVVPKYGNELDTPLSRDPEVRAVFLLISF
jgi:hypothetical protein